MRQTVQSVLEAKEVSDELIDVDAGAMVWEAIETMVDRKVGAVIIRNEDGLVDGIFTERDVLLRVVYAGVDPKTTTLSAVMTRDVRFVTPGDRKSVV